MSDIYLELQSWSVREDLTDDQLGWYRCVHTKAKELSIERGIAYDFPQAQSVAKWTWSRPNLNHSSASCRRRGALGNDAKTATTRERYRLIHYTLTEGGLTYKAAAEQFQVSLNTIKRAMRWQRRGGPNAEIQGGPNAERKGPFAGMKTSDTGTGKAPAEPRPVGKGKKTLLSSSLGETAVLQHQVAFQGTQIARLEKQLSALLNPSEDEPQAVTHSPSLALTAANS